ncbi:hypothetical protein OPT61_g7265 [Boeremia exigua]|uniref:Uncharacterized protein n=1 Tax=Boeremia exigua TaxID=749465 RepID=A0ACC2I362_9PLEO|nr:hypothetical protein OPT61_g7265 [Boeremia exigua]
MADTASWHLLPSDLLELQIGQIDLLMAMYPDDITISDQGAKVLDALRSALDESGVVDFNVAPVVSLELQLSITEADAPKEQSIKLDLTAPFTSESPQHPDEPPNFKVRIQQPSWMSRAATSQLQDTLPEAEDLLSTIEHVREAAARAHEESIRTQDTTASATLDSGPLVRVWFYFPSISTRSKRDDFITFAPAYNLTGFLYAGKPGLLCVEGGSQSIDEYMRFIKTESWGDIPAHHKKVSERYRESAERVFSDMTEITDTVGERRGQRQNRGDMKAVEEWLDERGLKEALTKVLIISSCPKVKRSIDQHAEALNDFEGKSLIPRRASWLPRLRLRRRAILICPILPITPSASDVIHKLGWELLCHLCAPSKMVVPEDACEACLWLCDLPEIILDTPGVDLEIGRSRDLEEALLKEHVNVDFKGGSTFTLD